MSTAVKVESKFAAYAITDWGIDGLQVQERNSAPLKATQVRVRIKAVSLNYRDLLVVKGLYSRAIKLPLIPASDGAGVVIEVGSEVKRFAVGDRVAGTFFQDWSAGAITTRASQSALGGSIDGVLTEQAVFEDDGLVKIPSHLSFEEAACLPCAAVTAWNALVASGQIKAGETVLTMGTGGVSLFALQIGKASGARVIITSSSNEKLQRAKAMGAADIINYRETPDWEKKVLELTGGVGVDHVVELGGAGTLPKSFKAVKPGGQISLIGVLTGGDTTVNPTPVLMKSIRLQGIFVGSREMFEDMNAAFELHKITPVIDKTFPFDQYKDALQHMESGAHFGKIVVTL